MRKKKVAAEPAPTKKVVLSKTYTFTIKEYDDGTSTMQRRNDGFMPLELLGIVNIISDDVIQQIKGLIMPDIIKREVVVD